MFLRTCTSALACICVRVLVLLSAVLVACVCAWKSEKGKNRFMMFGVIAGTRAHECLLKSRKQLRGHKRESMRQFIVGCEIDL